MAFKLDLRHRVLEHMQDCSNYDLWLTLNLFIVSSSMENVNTYGFMESFEGFSLYINIYIIDKISTRRIVSTRGNDSHILTFQIIYSKATR